LRRHVADLCVEFAITPVRPTHGHPRSRPGCRTVALQQISGPRGYWSCLYDIGYALADPSLDRPDREQAARAWAESIALDVPSPTTLDLVDVALARDEAEIDPGVAAAELGGHGL
jgi:hypothetical protein